MLTFVKGSYKCKAATKTQALRKRVYSRPSQWQYNQMQAIIKYLKANRYKRREAIYRHLQESFGVVVSEKRMYHFGGIGTFQWMPKKRCYRVQVGSGHININHAWLNYADCIEIYDYK